MEVWRREMVARKVEEDELAVKGRWWWRRSRRWL
jgi:hypothetical protein